MKEDLCIVEHKQVINRNRNTEILVNAGSHEIRIALLEDSTLQEIFLERKSNQGIVGNIYKGKVERVLPGMNSAFIDIGLERNAFLHIKDISQCRINSENYKITDFLRQGQSILVQVQKDPMGTKGARVSTDISIPSRYVVFMPNSDDIGVSVRIESEKTREFLRECVAKFSNGLTGGYIVRTAIEGATAWALRSDIKYLHKIWAQILEEAKDKKEGILIYKGLPLYLRILRDCVDETVSSIRVDSKEIAEEMSSFIDNFFPENKGLVSYRDSKRPIFDMYSIDDEIEKALKRSVSLKSGGYIVIDQTEAMTTIDVNTGKYVGLRNHSETIFKTNLEATKVIARQLRLRNLGGIIIIAFIDMLDNYHQEAVVLSLREAMDQGFCRYKIESMSGLGLLQMTRKRTRDSLGHLLCEQCTSCGGRGHIKTLETVVYEIMREIIREVAQFKPKGVALIVSHEVNDYLSEEEPILLADLEEGLKIPVKLQTDYYYEREHYNIALV